VQSLPVLAYTKLSNLIPLTAGLGAQGIPQFYVWKRELDRLEVPECLLAIRLLHKNAEARA